MSQKKTALLNKTVKSGGRAELTAGPSLSQHITTTTTTSSTPHRRDEGNHQQFTETNRINKDQGSEGGGAHTHTQVNLGERERESSIHAETATTTMKHTCLTSRANTLNRRVARFLAHGGGRGEKK